jgi:hypothetical protein
VEKPSRAIGLKKTKGARGDEPAESTPPSENEPGGIITPQMSTTNYVKSPRENEPGENSFGTIWDENSERPEWDHQVYKSQRDFWDSNPENGPLLGDVVEENSCGWAHMSLESVSGDSHQHVPVSGQLLAFQHHCPTGCPKGPGVRPAAMAPKMSKPVPPLPPWSLDDASAPAADDAAVRCCNARGYHRLWL